MVSNVFERRAALRGNEEAADRPHSEERDNSSLPLMMETLMLSGTSGRKITAAVP